MITWMTRMSFLDSVADLQADLLAQTVETGTELFMATVYGTYETLDPKDPSFNMWSGYEVALGAYVAAANAELATRGVYCYHHLSIKQTVEELRRNDASAVFDKPAWVDDIDVLRSHRSNLMRRWPKTYSWKRTPPLMPYVWPFTDDNGGYRLMLSKSDKALLATGERKLPTEIKNRIENL